MTSDLKMWGQGTRVDDGAEDEDDDAYGSFAKPTFNLDVLREAAFDANLRAKQDAKHQANKAEVMGTQLHDARIRVCTNPGVSTEPDDFAWDTISVLYDKQDQLEGNLAVGVDRFIAYRIGVRMSD
jgi:hypothetical protein